MRTLKLSVSFALLHVLPLAGCSSLPAVRDENGSRVRTLTSIGDRPIRVASGDPGTQDSSDLAAPAQATEPEREIAGRVVDLEGRPASNAEVRVAINGQTGGRVERVYTDESGRFTLHELRPGATYSIVAEWPDGEGGFLTGRSRTSVPSRSVEIALAPPGPAEAAPSGRVAPVSRRREGTGADEGPPMTPGGVVAGGAAPEGRINDEDLPLPEEADTLLAGEQPGAAPETGRSVSWRRHAGDASEASAVGGVAAGSAAAMSRMSAPDLPDEGPNPLPPAREPAGVTTGTEFQPAPGAVPVAPGEPAGTGSIAAAPPAGPTGPAPDERLIEKALSGTRGPSVPEIGSTSPTPTPAPMDGFGGSTPDTAAPAPPPSLAPSDTADPGPAFPPIEASPSDSTQEPPAPIGLPPTPGPDASSTAPLAPGPSSEPAAGHGDPAPASEPPNGPSADPTPDATDNVPSLPSTAPPSTPEPPVAEPSPVPPGPDDIGTPASEESAPPAMSDPSEGAPPASEPAGPDEPAPTPSTDPSAEGSVSGPEAEPPGLSDGLPPTPDAPVEEPQAAAVPRKRWTWGQLASEASVVAVATESTGAAPGPPALASRAPRVGPAPTDGAVVPASCRFDTRHRRIVDFQMTDVNGKALRFADLDADYILLDFWGTWCGPCVRSVPHLIELQNHYGRERLKVVGIAYEEGNFPERVATVRSVGRRLGINYDVLIGEADGKPCPLRDALKVQVYPTMVLVDREGRILWRDQGATPQTITRLDRVIAVNMADETRRR